MLRHLLAVLRLHGWLIVQHGIYIFSRCIEQLSLAKRQRFFPIMLILICILIVILILICLLLLPLIFLLFIYLNFIVTIPFDIHRALYISAVRCVHSILHAHMNIRIMF
jgi:hypothetical protein